MGRLLNEVYYQRRFSRERPHESKALLHKANFFLQLATQWRCETSSGQNCTCNTPPSQHVWQRNIALRVAGKVEASTIFNVVRYAPVCNMYYENCLERFCHVLRYKLQEKLPRVTAPLESHVFLFYGIRQPDKHTRKKLLVPRVRQHCYKPG